MSDQEGPFLEPDEEKEREPRPRAPRSRYSQDRASRRVSHFGRLEVGHVIGSTFSIWFGNLIPFSALALLIYSPSIILGYLFLRSGPNAEEWGRFGTIDTLATLIFFSNLLAGTVVYGVVMQLRGSRAGAGRCLTAGLSRLFHVLGVGILVGLVTYVWLVPGFFMALFAVLGGFKSDAMGKAVLVFLVGVVPFFIFLTRYYVAIPVVVLEPGGVFRGMSRSAQLTKGSRGTIFGVVVCMFLLLFLVGIPVGVVAKFVLAGVAPATQYLLRDILTTLLAPLSAIIPAVIFHDLRVGKEGADVDDLAAVFE